MRLLVLTGSLNEQDNERGYAHFVEHMAFRSTRNFPGDEKMKLLRKLGVAFGNHVNAETTHTRTSYKLDLPINTDQAVADGLRILRDVADGVLFEPAELDRERGVVLSEARVRRDPNQDRDMARSALAFAGTLVPQRWPIGTDASIKKARAAGLKAFYDAWYRPENIVVVVTGDVDRSNIAEQLAGIFGSLSGRGAPGEAPAMGKLAPKGMMPAQFYSETRNGVQVEVGSMRMEMPEPDIGQSRFNGLKREAASRMLRRRLKRLTNLPERPISSFGVDEGVAFNRFRWSTIVTVGDTNRWQTALSTLEQELRRALEHGFDATELKIVQDEMRHERKIEVSSSVTVPTEAFANWLVDQIEANRVATFPEERLERAMANIDLLTPEACQTALREMWGDAPKFIFMTASRQLLQLTADQLRAAYVKSGATAVEPAFALASVKFGYDDFGAPGEVVSKEHVPDLDVWLVRFANGVRLNLKRTDFEHQRVRFNVRVGSGRLDEPVEQPGISFFSGPATVLGGLKKYTDDELELALNGSRIDANFTCTDDAFQMVATSSTGELPLALRYVAAYLVDAAFRTEAQTRVSGVFNDTYLSMEQSAQGVVAMQIGSFLAGGDHRVSVPPRHMTQGHSIDSIGVWARPILEQGAIEVALVGDFDIDQAIGEMARTFGALGSRSPKPDLTGRRTLKLPRPPQSKTFHYGTSTKNRPTTLTYVWPVNQPTTLVQKQHFQMLAFIMDQRIRAKLREEKGETYAPSAHFGWNEVYANLASLQCQIEVKSNRAVKLGALLRQVVGDLGRQGITEDELAGAKAVYLAETHRWQRENAYWLNGVLADAQEHPWRLENARHLARNSADASVNDVNALARQYLTDQNLFQFTIQPKYHRR
jgi:zinc protease